MQSRGAVGLAASTAMIAATLAIVPASPAVADGPIYTPGNPPPWGVIFNDPSSSDVTEKRKISQHLRSLIDSATSGSFISMSIFRIGDQATVDSLIAADERGVHVRVIADGTSNDSVRRPGGYSAFHDLKSALGTDRTQGSWARYCQVSAISEPKPCVRNLGDPPTHNNTNNPDDMWKGNINHNKFALFTNVGGKRVTFVTSANFLSDASGDGAWNNAVAIVESQLNHPLYDDFAQNFWDQWRDYWTANDYWNDRTRTSTSSTPWREYFTPKKDDTAIDPTVSFLNQVNCSGSPASGFGENGKTVVLSPPPSSWTSARRRRRS